MILQFFELIFNFSEITVFYRKSIILFCTLPLLKYCDFHAFVAFYHYSYHFI